MSKGGRLARLFPIFFRGDKDKTEQQAVGGKNPVCLILFLDDIEQRISYKTNWKGQVLFDLVCGQANLVERDYFGLRFVDNAGQTHWVDLSKSLSSQLKGCSVPHKFYFCVKFYAADPCKLREEITRYLFYLQVKRDILQGRLPVTFDEAGELCAYAVQSELGDFDSRVHTTGYVSELCFVPNQTEDLEARIAGMHRRCGGATPLMAEHRFLEKVKWLKMYGVDLHPVQGESSVEYFLGLTPTGIVVYKHKSEVANYFWPRVTKATFKSKIFIIKVKDKNNDEHTYAFELSTKAACKHLWKCCVEHHAFFRLSQAKDKESRPTKVLRSLSNSSHRGRSERKALSDQMARQQPDVQRVPSRRQTRRVNSDPRLHDQYTERRRSPDRLITMMGHPQPVRAPRHRSLPELQGRESPRSTKSAPWESRMDYGLYTSGHDSTSERASQGRHPRTVSGSDSESGISHRKKYFPTRKGSDNESDGSTSRRRRREMDSDSGSEVSLTHGHGKKSTHKDHNRNDVHILYPFHEKDNHRNGSIPSLHSAPVGDAKQQRRRRRRSKSPGTKQKPPEELKQHIAFDLIETEGMTAQELQDIPYTKVETKASLFRMKYSPKFRQKIWQSRRKSFGEFDKQPERGKNLVRQDSRNTDPAGAYGGYTTYGSSMDEKPPPYNSVPSSRRNADYSSGPDYAQSGLQSSQQTSRSSPGRPISAGEMQMQYDSYRHDPRQPPNPKHPSQNPSSASSYHNPVYFTNQTKTAPSPQSFHRYDRRIPDTHDRPGFSPQSNDRPGFSPQSNYDRTNNQGYSSQRQQQQQQQHSQYQSNVRNTPPAQQASRGRQTPSRNLYQDFQDAALPTQTVENAAAAASISPSRISIGVTANQKQIQTPPRYHPNPAAENFQRAGNSPRYSHGTNLRDKAPSSHQDRNAYDYYTPNPNSRYEISPRTPPRSDQQWTDNPTMHMRGHSGQSASSSGYSGSHSRQSGGTPSGPSPLQSQSGVSYRPHPVQYSDQQSSQSHYQQQRSSYRGAGYHSSHNMSGRKQNSAPHPDQYSRSPRIQSHRSDLVTEL